MTVKRFTFELMQKCILNCLIIGHPEIKMFRPLAIFENFCPDGLTDFVSLGGKNKLYFSLFDFCSFDLYLIEATRESTMFSSIVSVVLAHGTIYVI